MALYIYIFIIQKAFYFTVHHGPVAYVVDNIKNVWLKTVKTNLYWCHSQQ